MHHYQWKDTTDFQEGITHNSTIIYKALCGLNSSGLRWAQRIHDIMLDMDFTPCVWIQKATCNTKYEYVAINVDDSLIAHDSPEEIIHTLKSKFNLKIQGDGPLEYHLGCDYYLDPNGTLVTLPKNTLQRLLTHATRWSQVKIFHM